jgi:dTDP-4-amino-4,6-dideoxygalactose transaminase
MAAIALAQLPHLDTENARRREIGALYDDGFAGNMYVTVVPTAPGCQSARHLYQITTDDRDGLLAALNREQIYPGVHFRDNSEYTIFAAQRGRCPNASRQSERLLSLPLHMRLSRADVGTVVDAINAYFR